MTTAGVPEVQFGWYLQRARKEAGLKQAEAALAVGVSKAGLGKWERSQAFPNIVHLRRLVELYDAPWLWEVVKGSPDQAFPTSKCYSSETIRVVSPLDQAA